MSHVDYDHQLYQSYEVGRQLSDATLALWINALAPFIGSAQPVRVLDLGAGTGRFTVPLAETFRAWVVAVEPSSKMRERGKSSVRAADAPYVAARAETLPFASETFDVVFASMVVHHCSDLTGVAAQLKRVIKPRGRILVRNSFRGRLDAIPCYCFFPGARTLDEARLPSIEDLSAAFSAVGLECIHHSVVRQQIDENLAAHLERLRLRSISTLALLSDAEFREGLDRLEQAVQHACGEDPVWEDIDLVVFGTPGSPRLDDTGAER